MDTDWEEDDVDIPVVVEDDQMEAQRALALSDRRAAHARSFIHSLLQAWKLLGYTPSPIKRSSLFQETFYFLFRLPSQRSHDTVIIIGTDLRV